MPIIRRRQTYCTYALPKTRGQPMSSRAADTPRIYASPLGLPKGYRTLACRNRDIHKIGFRSSCTLRLLLGIRSRDVAMTGSAYSQLYVHARSSVRPKRDTYPSTSHSTRTTNTSLRPWPCVVEIRLARMNYQREWRVWKRLRFL
jgi:hypothetical protein